MILHGDSELFKECLRNTAQRMSLPLAYIEKDYWVTYALKKIAESEINKSIVFKGGTSLSKAHRIISRFSEDIDIAILVEGLTDSQIKRRVKRIDKIVADDEIFTEIYSDKTSKNSNFRKVKYSYPSSTKNQSMIGQITDNILLEINAFSAPEPYKKMAICSYITDIYQQVDKNDFISKFKLHPFEINVLCTSRTICEKIMCMVKASYGDDGELNVADKIRHLYDIYYLMKDKFTHDFFESDDFNVMIKKVIESDRANFHSTPWFDIPLSNACAFSQLEKLWPSLDMTYHCSFKTMVVGKELPKPESLFNVAEKIHKKLYSIDFL